MTLAYKVLDKYCSMFGSTKHIMRSQQKVLPIISQKLHVERITVIFQSNDKKNYKLFNPNTMFE